jgi:hypothetical protein
MPKAEPLSTVDPTFGSLVSPEDAGFDRRLGLNDAPMTILN